jgi:hypothetical protein
MKDYEYSQIMLKLRFLFFTPRHQPFHSIVSEPPTFRRYVPAIRSFRPGWSVLDPPAPPWRPGQIAARQ